MRYQLRARRGIADRYIAESDTMKNLTAYANRMENNGEWPEGFDAIIVDTEIGEAWLYTHKLERI